MNAGGSQFSTYHCEKKKLYHFEDDAFNQESS